MGSYGSSRIGQAFHGGNLDPFSQALLHGALGATSAAILGGEPVAGAIGAVIGEIVGSAYREGAFGNEALDQNSASYADQVEYGVAFAKMAAVLAVGLTGGDVNAAAFAAENAARYNSFAIHDFLELRHLEIQRDAAKTDEERARIDALIEHSVLKTRERGAQFVVDELSKDLPDPILGPITSWNQALQRQIDQRERAFQEYNQIFPGLGTALMVANWQTTLGPYMLQLPTTRGGALIALAPSMKAGGSAVVKGTQSLGRKALTFAEKRLGALRGDSTSFTALPARPLESPYYSNLYTVKMPSEALTRGRRYHNQIGNEALHKAFESDPHFANALEREFSGIIEGIQQGPRGAFPREAPTPELTWHHYSYEDSVLELIPKAHHQASGAVQKNLHPHPSGGGGYAQFSKKGK